MGEDMDPVTKQHFDKWRMDEFIPHTVREEIYEHKVDRLWWTAITAIAMGGIIVSIFMWVLLQKNSQIEAMQVETTRIALNQAGVIKTLESHSEELRRQQQVDANLMSVLLELTKQQAVLHADVISNNRKPK